MTSPEWTEESAKEFVGIHSHFDKLANDERLWSMERVVITQYLGAKQFLAGLEVERTKRVNFYAEVSRIIEWMKTSEPAITAFTEGPERQLAYAIEADRRERQEEVESLRTQLVRDENHGACQAEIQKLGKEKAKLVDMWGKQCKEHGPVVERLVEALKKITEQRVDGFDWPLHCQIAKDALAPFQKPQEKQ